MSTHQCLVLLILSPGVMASNTDSVNIWVIVLPVTGILLVGIAIIVCVCRYTCRFLSFCSEQCEKRHHPAQPITITMPTTTVDDLMAEFNYNRPKHKQPTAPVYSNTETATEESVELLNKNRTTIVMPPTYSEAEDMESLPCGENNVTASTSCTIENDSDDETEVNMSQKMKRLSGTNPLGDSPSIKLKKYRKSQGEHRRLKEQLSHRKRHSLTIMPSQSCPPVKPPRRKSNTFIEHADVNKSNHETVQVLAKGIPQRFSVPLSNNIEPNVSLDIHDETEHNKDKPTPGKNEHRKHKMDLTSLDRESQKEEVCENLNSTENGISEIAPPQITITAH